MAGVGEGYPHWKTERAWNDGGIGGIFGGTPARTGLAQPEMGTGAAARGELRRSAGSCLFPRDRSGWRCAPRELLRRGVCGDDGAAAMDAPLQQSAYAGQDGAA